MRIVATASATDAADLRDLGADQVIDDRTARFDDVVKDVDAVIDLVGGETADRSYAVLKPGVRLMLTSGADRSAGIAGELCDIGPVEPKPYDHKKLLQRIRSLLAQSNDG
jgi:NADPH:quinone reductase-like Zn-dependent oxidoreductase